MTKEIIRPVLWMDYIFSWDTGCIPLRPQKGKGLRRRDKWRPPSPGCSFPTSWNITSKAHAWQPPPPRCPSSREGTGWKNTELGLRDQVPRLIMSPQAISGFFTQPGKRQALQPGPIVFSASQTVDPAHQRLLASAGLPPRAAAGLTRPSPW